GKAGRDHGAAQQLQRPGDVDPLAAGDGAALDRAVAAALAEVGDGDGPVDRGIEGDGEDHGEPAEPPLRRWRALILSSRLRILSSCILRLSSGVLLCPRRGLPGGGSPFPELRPRVVSSRPTTITIAPTGMRIHGFWVVATALSVRVAASTDSAATSGVEPATRPSTVTVAWPSVSPLSTAPLTSSGASTSVSTC